MIASTVGSLSLRLVLMASNSVVGVELNPATASRSRMSTASIANRSNAPAFVAIVHETFLIGTFPSWSLKGLADLVCDFCCDCVLVLGSLNSGQRRTEMLEAIRW